MPLKSRKCLFWLCSIDQEQLTYLSQHCEFSVDEEAAVVSGRVENSTLKCCQVGESSFHTNMQPKVFNKTEFKAMFRHKK